MNIFDRYLVFAAIFFCCGCQALKLPVHPYEHYKWQNVAPSKKLLNEVKSGIEFAFKIDAAREISFWDLDHFHLLLDQNLNLKESDVLSAISKEQGIILHSQEKVNYGAERYGKRSILVRNGKASFIPPHGGMTFVSPGNLGFQEEVWWTTGYIIDISNLDPRKKQPPKENILVVGSKRLYIGFTKESPPADGDDSVASVP